MSEIYLRYWGLQERPFENTADRRFLYPTDGYADACRKLRYAISGERGGALLSGDSGSGKTLIVRSIVNQLNPTEFVVGLVNYPLMRGEHFLREVLGQFNGRKSSSSRSSLFRALSRAFYENLRQGRRSLLVIDEAQLLSDRRVFQELWLLLNIQLRDCFLLKLLLVGQPSVWLRLSETPELDQLMAVRCRLKHLTLEETAAYVDFRLRVAGSDSSMFTEESLYLIHRFSRGIPRKINNLADSCMLEACERGMDEVDGELFRYVV